MPLDAHPTDPLQVVCLCAAWCGTCKDYAQSFAQLATEFPQCQFRWVDIEDEADVVDDFDVENFPTILLARAGAVRFLGTLTPHMDTLRRLLQNHSEELACKAVDNAQAQALGLRLGLI